ncbi:Peroxisomal membrane protein PMP47B [Exophiala dermatitidis]
MSQYKNIAPAPTEADLDSNKPTPTSSGAPVTPSRRAATPATSAAQQGDNIAHALAGAGGGLLAMTLTYPLITLSTRAQVESKRADTSTLAAIKHIINREGITGLYAGLDSALFGISITNFVYYYWYEWTKAFFERAAIKAGRAGKKLTTVESMIAGAIAGSATVLLTNPIWVINTRMTARKNDDEGTDPQKKKPSTIGTLLKLLREEGPSSLFAGVLPALVLVINPILQYTIYEQLKHVLEKRRKVGPRDAFYLGALGKLLATTITYPYLTVKSRAHVATKDAPVEGMWTSLNKIVREEGWGGLYKGIVPKVSQSVITAAFLFAFKDVLYDMTVAARKKARTAAVKA